MERELKGWIDEWMHACMHGWMDGWMDGGLSIHPSILTLHTITYYLPLFLLHSRQFNSIRSDSI